MARPSIHPILYQAESSGDGGGGVNTYDYLSEVYDAITALELVDGDQWQMSVNHPVLGTYVVKGSVVMGEPSFSQPIPFTQLNPTGQWQDAVTGGSQYSVTEVNESYVLETSGTPVVAFSMHYFDGVSFSRFSNLRLFGEAECATPGGESLLGASIHRTTTPNWQVAGNRVYAIQIYWWSGAWRVFRAGSVNGSYSYTSQGNVPGGNTAGFFSPARQFQSTFDVTYLTSFSWRSSCKVQTLNPLIQSATFETLGSSWRDVAASSDRYYVGMDLNPAATTVGMKVTLHGVSCDHSNQNILDWPT